MTDDSDRPSFLAALSANPALRADAVSLFAAALSDSETRQETWQALERLTSAATETQQVDALGELLHDLCLQPGVAREQVIFYLRLWALRNSKRTAVIGDAQRRSTHEMGDMMGTGFWEAIGARMSEPTVWYREDNFDTPVPCQHGRLQLPGHRPGDLVTAGQTRRP